MINQSEFIAEIHQKALIRQFYICKIIKFLGQLKRIHPNYKKSRKAFVYVTICNRKSFPMLKYSILSFLKNSSMFPEKIVVVSDGTWDLMDGQEYFKFLKIPICFEKWENSANYHKFKGRLELYEYACKQIWGKKLAAILKYSEQSLTLFSDPDILWYGSPIDNTILSKNFLLKLSTDNSHNYDTDLIKEMNAEYLYDTNPINCGVVLIKGDMYLHSKKIVQAINKESKNPGNYSEQTIFAIISHEFGANLWSKDEISAEIDDILSPILRKSKYQNTLIARHYLYLLKWLYWRDVLTQF